jgi:hypothetical protein
MSDSPSSMAKFQPSISALPPQLSMVTSSTALNPSWRPRRPKIIIPKELWDQNLKDIFLSHPKSGLSANDLDQLFYEQYDHHIIPQIFGFYSLQELLESIPQLVYKRWLFWMRRNC